MSRLLLFAALWGLPAAAWPVDRYIQIAPEKEAIPRIPQEAWVYPEPGAPFSVEKLPSGELLIAASGAKPGFGLLALGVGEQFSVWGVEILPSKELEEAKDKAESHSAAVLNQACPGSTLDNKGKGLLALKSAACRKRALAELQKSTFESRGIQVAFDLAALQAQLAEIRDALAKLDDIQRPELSYSGATLLMRGTLSEADRPQVLLEIFRHSVGRVLLDDQTQNTQEKKP